MLKLVKFISDFWSVVGRKIRKIVRVNNCKFPKDAPIDLLIWTSTGKEYHFAVILGKLTRGGQFYLTWNR